MALWSRTESAVSPAQEVARVAEVAAAHAAFSWFQRHERDLSELQLELAAIPAPPFGEAPRANWLQRQFTRFGLEDAHIDEIGNVIARFPGSDPAAAAVALSAHIDTVFPAGTPLQPRREGEKLYGPGVSDNASGVVALLAIAQALRQAQVRTTAPLIFVGNVGEEGEGDLRGMRHLFSDPQWQDAIQYCIVVDGASSDTIVTRGLGSRRYEVTLRGPGGHSWSDFGAPNPIVVLAGAIEAFSRVDASMAPAS